MSPPCILTGGLKHTDNLTNPKFYVLQFDFIKYLQLFSSGHADLQEQILEKGIIKYIGSIPSIPRISNLLSEEYFIGSKCMFFSDSFANDISKIQTHSVKWRLTAMPFINKVCLFSCPVICSIIFLECSKNFPRFTNTDSVLWCT